MGLFDFFKSRKLKQAKCSNSSANEEQHLSGVCNIPLDAKYTPESITTLGRRDIFVFGSNLAGHHVGGAARVALNRFGAVWGQGEGLQGNSYAIPTMQGSVETIKPYVDRFIEFAEYEKALTFYVTKIGCGIAGFAIKDIAPLFRNAYNLPNVILPIEFVDYIEKENRSIHPQRILDTMEAAHDADIIERNQKNGSCIVNTCSGVTTHCFGMTRTFADIILGLNEEKKYTSPDQALSDLGAYLKRFNEQGDNIAFLSVRILQCILHDNPDIFASGYLNVSRLRELVFEDENFLSSYDKAYDSYCKEKLLNLVAYLNELRRYSKPEELRRDLFENTDVLKFSACTPIHGFYYFVMSGATGMNYPVQFFVRAIRNLWSEITTDGILDADKMRQLMFGNHDEAVKKLGLEATIQRDYIEDSPCHPEVFVPKVMGTAPIYVKDEQIGRYIRSCGEGKGPNSIPDWLEFQIAKQILEKDKSYKQIGNYYIPKYDNTLPVYGEYSGRLVFRTQEEKLKFIEEVKQGKTVWR